MKTRPKENLQYVVDDQGHRVSVVLPVDRYEAMLEDIADLGRPSRNGVKKSTSITPL